MSCVRERRPLPPYRAVAQRPRRARLPSEVTGRSQKADAELGVHLARHFPGAGRPVKTVNTVKVLVVHTNCVYVGTMLRDVARRLDEFVIAQNLEARAEGLPSLRPCVIKLLGQRALIESGASLRLAATKDVDVFADYEHTVEAEFRRLLAREGLELDPVAHEIWMPAETKYEPLFQGRFVTLLVADTEAVLLSKGLKAPRKNGPLLTEYLAQGASSRFLALAHEHGLDLEQFL
jgi:hypothetical protein